MALNYYQNYINNIAKAPSQDWQDLMQAAVDDTWSDTSTVRTLQGQLEVGGTIYGNESLQLNSVIDPKTGEALGDNYRKIIYQNYNNNRLPPNKVDADKFNVESNDGNYQYITVDGEAYLIRTSDRFLGKYYKFDGETWLTINTGTKIGALATAILQRCNNLLQWYDKEGNFHCWDCVFDRTLSSTGFDYGSKGVIEANATTKIKVQRNEETNLIEINQRFMFDGFTFQVKQINNHISDTYLELYLFEVQVQSNDDVENNIANVPSADSSETTDTSIMITPVINSLLQGESQTFSVYQYADGEPTATTFSFSLRGPLQNVNYTFMQEDGNNFTIENLLKSTTPLTITCTSNTNPNDFIEISLMLGGAW
jgi:hypothetical protein